MTDSYTPIPINAVIEDSETHEKFRIVSISATQNIAFLYGLSEKGWPYAKPLDEIRKNLRGRKYVYVSAVIKPFLAAASDTAEKLHDKRYELIKPLVSDDNLHLVLDGRCRGRQIRLRATEAGTSRANIENLLKKWFKNGMNFDSLAPGFHLCGANGKKRNLSGQKVGRPRRYRESKGVNSTAEIRQMMAIGADYYFGAQRQGHKPSIKDAHEHLLGLFFSKIENDKNNRPVPKTIEGSPTLRQFEYYLDTHHPYRERRKARIGTKQFDGHERPIIGRADHDVQGPGDRFEIDATIADVYLVSQYDRSRIVGRPIIYFSVDTFSRLITGIYVGFEGPSWIGAMMVLTNIVTPKVDFCRSFGIEIGDDDWPSQYLPKQILADRGELLSVPLGNKIIDNLRVEIQNTRPGRGDMKAIVERRFNIIQTKWSSFVPGYVHRDFGDRGARDYRLDAALTLREFTQIVIYGVLAHNQNKITSLAPEPGLVALGKDNTPLERWVWGIENRSGLLHTLSVEKVALEVMPEDRAVILPKGIKFKDGYYICDEAIRADWFVTRNRRASDYVDVSYDPRSLDIVYLRDRRLPNGFVALSLSERSLDRAGKSLSEIEELTFEAKRIEHQAAPYQQAQRISLNAKAQEICDVAVANRDYLASQATVSKSTRLSDIRDNRREEKLTHRKTESFKLTEARPTAEQAVFPRDTTATDELALLRKLREARDGEASPEI